MVSPERIRLFVGSTELNYSVAQIIKTSDHIVNQGTIEIEANSEVTSSSVIDFKKSDGSTTIFSAKVQNKKEIDMWKLKVLANGYELHTTKIENVYKNQSPESIVQDIVDNRTNNLTYISGPASGFTVKRYIANAYAIDVIKDMMDLLQWQIKIDENDNVKFEPKGTKNIGRTFTNGSNIQITSWEEEKQEMFNKVTIIGGFENFSTTEKSGSAGTTFILAHKPSGVMSVGSATPSGTVELSPSVYTVNAEDKQVILDNSVNSPVFFYSFDRPVVVKDQDDSSILENDEIFQEFQAPWLNTLTDARKYAQNLLDVHSTPEIRAKGTEPQLNFDSEVGELITLVDDVRNKERQFVITKIVIKAESNTTEYDFGSREFVFFDWQRQVQERIKKLERRFTNEDEIIFARTFKHKTSGTVTINNVWKFNSPNDSFVLDHPTLGRLRANLNEAADSSPGIANVGTWLGTGLDGVQSGTAGFRLSSGSFNGSDNEVTSEGNESGVQTLSMAIKPDTNNRDVCQLTSSAKVSINSSDQITTSGFTNPIIYVDNVQTSSITLNQFNNVVVTFDSLLANAIKIGHSSSWFSGEIDEFTLFDKKISSEERQGIIDKVFYSNRPLYANCLLWYSFDNCRLGNRFSQRITI